jgi:hypothetical protein
MKNLRSIFLAAAFSIGVYHCSFGQATLLIIEHQRNHTQRVIGRTGQNVRYMVRGSDKFNAGRIVSITDSTVLFENNIPGMVITVQVKDIHAVKKARSTGRVVVGGGFLLMGLALTLMPTDSDPTLSGMENASKLILVPPILAIGIALVSPRKIYLNETWVLKAAKEADAKK